jgi:hypothetical protein
VAGVVPAVYAALKLDEHIPKAARLAGEYKNLEILFADLGKVGPYKDFDVFETGIQRSEKPIRSCEQRIVYGTGWCFRRARKKIKAGHYTFD